MNSSIFKGIQWFGIRMNGCYLNNYFINGHTLIGICLKIITYELLFSVVQKYLLSLQSSLIYGALYNVYEISVY